MGCRKGEANDDHEREADEREIRGASSRPSDGANAEIRRPHDPGDERCDHERVDALATADEPADADADSEREGRDGDEDGAGREPVEHRQRRRRPAEDGRLTPLETALLPEVET